MPVNNRTALRVWLGRWIGLLSILSVAGIAQAQVVMEGSRVVFPADREQQAVSLKNMGEQPVLVQAWVSDGPADQPPEQSRAPFALAPPVARLDAGKSKHVRIRQLRSAAPTDHREHLYWLNVLAVPPQVTGKEGSHLQLVVRSRYKLLYRPPGLGEPTDPPAQLRIEASAGGQQLVLRNTSPFYINLGYVFARWTGGAEQELDNPAVPPQGSVSIELPAQNASRPGAVRFAWIDDQGTLHEVVRTL